MKTSGELLRPITISIGATQYVPNESCSAMIERADRGLYRAKHEGRNRTVVETDEPETSAA